MQETMKFYNFYRVNNGYTMPLKIQASLDFTFASLRAFVKNDYTLIKFKKNVLGTVFLTFKDSNDNRLMVILERYTYDYNRGK